MNYLTTARVFDAWGHSDLPHQPKLSSFGDVLAEKTFVITEPFLDGLSIITLYIIENFSVVFDLLYFVPSIVVVSKELSRKIKVVF